MADAAGAWVSQPDESCASGLGQHKGHGTLLERSKTDKKKATYHRFILENSGAVKSGFCPCKGGLVLHV